MSNEIERHMGRDHVMSIDIHDYRETDVLVHRGLALFIRLSAHTHTLMCEREGFQ